jgi:predicted MFS family arabinose efflux permease
LLDRRRLLIGLTALLVAANAAAALVSSFAMLLAARVGVGFSIGGYWAIAGRSRRRAAAPAVGPGERGRLVSS